MPAVGSTDSQAARNFATLRCTGPEPTGRRIGAGASGQRLSVWNFGLQDAVGLDEDVRSPLRLVLVDPWAKGKS